MPKKNTKHHKPKNTKKTNTKSKAKQHPKPLDIPKDYDTRKKADGFNESEFTHFIYGLTPKF